MYRWVQWLRCLERERDDLDINDVPFPPETLVIYIIKGMCKPLITKKDAYTPFPNYLYGHHSHARNSHCVTFVSDLLRYCFTYSWGLFTKWT